MSGRIYITYNSDNNTHIEESTALRLQTLSNLYGINVDLPYRTSIKFNLDQESKKRIENADYIIVFSLTSLSNRLRSEIEYALSKSKPIIIVYDKKNGKNIYNFDKTNVSEVYLDAYNSEEKLKNIATFLDSKLPKKTLQKKEESKTFLEENAAGIALISVALGLLALALLSNNEE